MFDFGVGYSELFVLAIVAIIVIGPKDLPRVLRTFGQFMNKMRGMAKDFQSQVDVAMKDSGVGDLKQDMASLKSVMNAPSMLSPNPSNYGVSSAAKDFEGYFGPDATKGETRVSGVLAVQSKPDQSSPASA